MENRTSGGIGFLGALTILFITLKLCGVIAWSWVWVLSPLWIGAIIAVAFVGTIAIMALCSMLMLLAIGAALVKEIKTDDTEKWVDEFERRINKNNSPFKDRGNK